MLPASEETTQTRRNPLCSIRGANASKSSTAVKMEKIKPAFFAPSCICLRAIRSCNKVVPTVTARLSRVMIRDGTAKGGAKLKICPR